MARKGIFLYPDVKSLADEFLAHLQEEGVFMNFSTFVQAALLTYMRAHFRREMFLEGKAIDLATKVKSTEVNTARIYDEDDLEKKDTTTGIP